MLSEQTKKLQTEVAETRTIMASAAVLIQGLRDRLKEALDADDTEALEELATDLDEGQNDLAAAVAQNTPAADIAETDVITPNGPGSTTTGGTTEDTVTGGQGSDTIQGGAGGDEG